MTQVLDSPAYGVRGNSSWSSVCKCEILILELFLNLQRRCTRCALEMSYIRVDFSSRAPATTRDESRLNHYRSDSHTRRSNNLSLLFSVSQAIGKRGTVSCRNIKIMIPSPNGQFLSGFKWQCHNSSLIRRQVPVLATRTANFFSQLQRLKKFVLQPQLAK